MREDGDPEMCEHGVPLGPGACSICRDLERAALLVERDQLVVERAALVVERDQLVAERTVRERLR